ncbi:hypothetical protein LTR67_009274 [Exophiala xenobiotica]
MSLWSGLFQALILLSGTFAGAAYLAHLKNSLILRIEARLERIETNLTAMHSEIKGLNEQTSKCTAECEEATPPESPPGHRRPRQHHAEVRVGRKHQKNTYIIVKTTHRQDLSPNEKIKLVLDIMVEVKQYQLPPTALIPNSPQPLLHYPGFLSVESGNDAATKIYDLFSSNGWKTQWIFRYGQTQTSHYHSMAHECMVVLTGTATIRFGVADTDPDLEKSTFGSGREEGGIEVEARAGDVFVLPAGTAHKTYNTNPLTEFKLLTPGDGHSVAAEDVRYALANIELSGFTMIGAYPKGGGEWDFAKGGENAGGYEQVWSVPKPERDPVLGESEEGLCGRWT